MEDEAGFDRYKSLLQLCGDELEDQLDEVPLAVLNKPVRKLRAGELHFLLQRHCALEVTVPLALDLLERDPFAEAQGSPGDLLVALLEASTGFWLEHLDLWMQACEVLQRVVERITSRAEQEERGDYMPFYVGDDFMAAVVHFRSIHGEPADEDS